MNKTSITIIGAGEIGRAIKKILEHKDVELSIWDKDPSRVLTQIPLSELIPTADFLFICVPSEAVREVLENIKSYLQSKTIIVSLAKGIDKQTKYTVDKMLEEFLPKDQPFALLGGAMLAEEISNGLKSAGIIATKNKEDFKKLSILFNETNLITEYSEDVHGVAWAGILKNIYALALGIADGLNWSDNQKGWLVSKAIGEMVIIIKILGGDEKTVCSVAGLGDLIATGYSSCSSNHRAGQKLATTGEIIKSEGTVSLPSLIHLLGDKKEQPPLLTTLEKVLSNPQNTKTFFNEFTELF